MTVIFVKTQLPQLFVPVFDDSNYAFHQTFFINCKNAGCLL